MEHISSFLNTGRSYIFSQFRQSDTAEGHASTSFVTISRQTGAGGITIAEKLGNYLSEHDQTLERDASWTVYEKNLIEQVIREHRLDPIVANYMPEDAISEIDDILEGLFGLHPSEWSLVHKTAQTILRLATQGHVILVGRAANLVTRQLETGLHVRLVGSLERRARHLEEYYHWTTKQAKAAVEKEDTSRANYLKKYFNADINNPLLYHLVINTDHVSYDETARIIWDAVLSPRKLNS